MLAPSPAHGTFSRLVQVGEAATAATQTVLNLLFKEFGRPGSLLDHPKGQSFALASDYGEGAVHSHHGIFVPLGQGRSVRHDANVVVELEGSRTLFVDILEGHDPMDRFKAHGFDALHLKNAKRSFHGCLVLVRTSTGGQLREVVEAVCHGYDYVFGVDEADVRLGIKFAALKSEILKWLRRERA